MVRRLQEGIAGIEIEVAGDGSSKRIRKARSSRFDSLAIFNRSIVVSQSKALEVLPADGGDCKKVLLEFSKAGIDVEALSGRLQGEGAKSLVNSWNDMMEVISSSSSTLKEAAV